MAIHRLAWARGLLALGAVMLTVQRAHASGFAAARFGGELGNVTATNPTALYYNPAGIAFASGTSFYVDGTVALRHASWDHPASGFEAPDPPEAPGANNGKTSLLNVFGAPMAGVAARFGKLAAGASFSVPFGGRVHWPQNESLAGNATYPLAADGIQRWHITEGALTYLYATLGVAYRTGPVAFGITGNLVHSAVSFTQAKSFNATGTPDTTTEGRDTLDVSGFEGSFGAGVMVEAIPARLWIAASYQSQPALGPMRLKGDLTLSYGGGQTTTPVTFDHALPDVWRLGARFRASPDVELRLFGDFTRWSVLVTQCIAIAGHACSVDSSGADAAMDGSVVQNMRRRWRDTFGVHAGMSRFIGSHVELFGGMAFETAASPDATLAPDLPDADNVALAAGGRFEVARTWFVGVSYTHIQYVTRDNIGKSELSAAALPTKWADGGGQYTQWIGVLNANLEKQF
jgi:long-chain fatty acid transport protein